MKIKFGALVVDGRGKIGGQVASRNRAGAYMRNKVTPVNPNTASQQAVRALLTELSQSWRDLAEAQRSAWNSSVADFAKTDIFGDIKSPTGFNLYVRLNANIETVEQTQITNPPLVGSVDFVDLTAAVLNITGSVGTIAFTPTIPTGMTSILRATPSLSQGISFVKSELRIIDLVPDGTATGHDIWAAYVAKFGTPTEGAKVFFSLETVNEITGQKSVSSQVSTTVLNA